MDARLGNIRTVDRGINLAKALIVIDQADDRRGLKNIDSALAKLSDGSVTARKVIDLDFPSMYSIHGIDIWNEVKNGIANKSLTNKDALGIVMVFNELIHRVASNERNLYPTLDQGQLAQFIADYDNWVTKVNMAMASGEISGASVQKLRAEKAAIKKNWSKSWVIYAIPGRLTLADLPKIKQFIETGQGNLNLAVEIGSIKIATTSFSNFRNTINGRIQELWSGYSKSLGTTKDAPKETFEGIQARTGATLSASKLTTVFNWGHTATEDPTTGKRTILSPKILTQLVSANLTSEQRELVNYDFQVRTGQIRTVIKTSQRITKDNQAVLELAISSGLFQSVLFQNEKYNQVTLGQAERAYNLRTRLRDDPAFRAQLGINTVEQLGIGLINNHSSLSFKEKILGLITHALAGKTPGSDILGNTTKTSTTKRTVKGLTASVKNNINTGRKTQTAKPTKITLSKVTSTSLADLQTLLDTRLATAIRENMGTGSRRDVLNYRTGRFASSVKVERLSESRQGMITAFYTYMRNPYATFSGGGQQQFPRSRDPKLLISKSIRELAQQLAITKLRAQLI